MLTTIRFDSFETNSSSTHAFVLVPADVVSAWEERPNDWLDFSSLLDFDWGTAGEKEANIDCLVSEDVMWERRQENGWVDDDELITLNILPLDALSHPTNWFSQAAETWMKVEERPNGDVLLEIDYMA